MAITGKIYGKVFTAAFNKEIDLADDTIKVALTTSSYTPDQDGDDYFNDVVGNEISGTGYTAGGATLASKTLTYTGATNKWVFDAADTTWTTSTITARTAVVYDASPGSDATRPLICYQQSDSDITTTAATFTIQWASAGIVEITVG